MDSILATHPSESEPLPKRNQKNAAQWRQRESIDLGDQAVLSHPILIIVLTHSGGKYDLHNRTFRSARSMSAARSAISAGAPEPDERCGVKIEASIFITMVRRL
jgi:hypothetical protein